MTKTQLNTFLGGFKLSSTGNTTDVGSADIKRKLLAIYIKRVRKQALRMSCWATVKKVCRWRRIMTPLTLPM